MPSYPKFHTLFNCFATSTPLSVMLISSGTGARPQKPSLNGFSSRTPRDDSSSSGTLSNAFSQSERQCGEGGSGTGQRDIRWCVTTPLCYSGVHPSGWKCGWGQSAFMLPARAGHSYTSTSHINADLISHLSGVSSLGTSNVREQKDPISAPKMNAQLSPATAGQDAQAIDPISMASTPV